MATQTELDRLYIAWGRLQTLINTTLPSLRSRLAALRSRLISTRPPSRML